MDMGGRFGALAGQRDDKAGGRSQESRNTAHKIRRSLNRGVMKRDSLCRNRHPRPCTLAALAIAPLPARIFAPNRIGILVSVHLPAQLRITIDKGLALARVFKIGRAHV